MFTIYTTTSCAYCQMVKKLFALKEVEYKEVNLDDNPELRDHVIQLSNAMTVPVVIKTENGQERFISTGWKPHELLPVL